MGRHDVRDQEYQCGDKRRYPTRSIAKKQLRRFRAQRHPLQAYRCPHCGFWHLGRKLA